MEAATDDNEQRFKMVVVGKGLRYVPKLALDLSNAIWPKLKKPLL